MILYLKRLLSPDDQNKSVASKKNTYMLMSSRRGGTKKKQDFLFKATTYPYQSPAFTIQFRDCFLEIMYPGDIFVCTSRASFRNMERPSNMGSDKDFELQRPSSKPILLKSLCAPVMRNPWKESLLINTWSSSPPCISNTWSLTFTSGHKWEYPVK